MRWLPLICLTGCVSYAHWPDQRDVFPWGPASWPALEDYETVRWEEGP